MEKHEIVERFLKEIKLFQYDFDFTIQYDRIFGGQKENEKESDYVFRKAEMYMLLAHEFRVIHITQTPGFRANSRYTISEKGQLIIDFGYNYAEWQRYNSEKIDFVRNEYIRKEAREVEKMQHNITTRTIAKAAALFSFFTLIVAGLNFCQNKKAIELEEEYRKQEHIGKTEIINLPDSLYRMISKNRPHDTVSIKDISKD